MSFDPWQEEEDYWRRLWPVRSGEASLAGEEAQGWRVWVCFHLIHLSFVIFY